MKRFFISQHPTFGSYKNPIADKVEQSPYYYWWLALTLNREYTNFCDASSAGKNVHDHPMKEIFNDFGDVRYEGDKYKAFALWWRRKVNDTETMGEYLFSEPLTPKKVALVEDEATAKNLLTDASSILINIPKNLSRKQIDKALENIFRRELSFEKGRRMRNPTRSNARYNLSKPVKAHSLKIAFDIILVEREAQEIGKKMSNIQLADACGIKVNVSSTTKSEQSDLAEYETYLLSTTVSRKKKLAKTAIANAANGLFP